MKNNVLEINREAVTFFYMIFSHRIREGMNPNDARNESYDAVTLRYGISRGRLLNIISQHKNSQSVNQSKLRQNAISLIKELQIANSGLQDSIQRNDKLISLLKECVEDGS